MNLIFEGIQQMRELGAKFRTRYVQEHHLLDPALNTSQLYIRSTGSKRTVESAQHVLEGMFADSARKSEEEITINVLDRNDENMYPRSGCKRLGELKKNIKKSEEYQKF